MIRRSIKIINKLGLHARAATKLVEITKSFSSDISINRGDSDVNGKSIMSLLILAAPKHSEIEVVIEGTDEVDAMEAIVTLIENRFDEDE